MLIYIYIYIRRGTLGGGGRRNHSLNLNQQLNKSQVRVSDLVFKFGVLDMVR